MTIKNSTIYKIFGVAVVVALFAYSIINALLNSSSKPPVATPPPAGQINISTNSGAVPVKDFTKNPAEAVNGNLAVQKTGQFTIDYYPQDQSFVISLSAQPIQKSRDAAEQALLSDLGLDQITACKLKVSLTVPFNVDNNLAGQDYGLSFCPLGKPF